MMHLYSQAQTQLEILNALSKDKKNIFCLCVGAITEKIARQSGYINTISAGGNVNVTKEKFQCLTSSHSLIFVVIIYPLI